MIIEKWYRSGKQVFRVNDEKFLIPEGQEPDEIKKIPLERLVDDPDMPRMTEDAYKVLVQDIFYRGMRKPVLVKPCECKDGYFHIIIGHNRCRALLDLNYRYAECIVWDKPVSCEGKIPVTQSGHKPRDKR